MDNERRVERVYSGLFALVVGLLKVPEGDLLPPPGTGRVLAETRPSPSYLRYMMVYFWIVTALGAVVALLPTIALLVTIPLLGILVLPLAAALVLLWAFIRYAALRMRYDTTTYLITDRAVRLRHGIWQVAETTLTYANVQNLKVEQGPLERWFGVTSVILETAGGGGHGQAGFGGFHRGVLAGLADPKAVHDIVQERLRIERGAGLGDKDDHRRDVARLALLGEVGAAAARLRRAAETP